MLSLLRLLRPAAALLPLVAAAASAATLLPLFAAAAVAGCCVVAAGAALLLVSVQFSLYFRLCSLSLRPLLRSCQVHTSARRVACM